MKLLLLALLLASAACVEPVEVAEGFDASTAPDDAGAVDASLPEPDAGSTACVPETDRAFCTRLGKQCGPVTDFDNCDMSRTTNCGGCDAPLECGAGGTANQCGCPETRDAFCARLGKNCGQVSAEDACGLMRLVDCGGCTAPQSCGGGGDENVCGCTPKSCAEASAECGQVADGCGGTLECGGCQAGFGCGLRTANRCEQEPPEIDVLPSPLDFGTVPTGSTVTTKTVSIWNLASGTTGVKREQLKLQARNGAGTWVDAPPEISGSGEFQLVLPVQGYTAAGIAESQKVDLQVKYTPVTAGTRTARIVIFSNDPDEPTVEVDVTGTGRVVPPCSYEVLPATLDFGVVDPSTPKTLNVSVRNLSQVTGEDCELTNLEFSPPTPAAYSLPGGAANRVIPAGATLQIPVRFAPSQFGDFRGSLSFRMSSNTAPTATVALTAVSGRVCLSLVPENLDFGQTGVGCTSATKSVTLINTCTTSVSLTGIDLVQSGSEFRLTLRPAFPFILAPGSSVQTAVAYSPADVGADSATLEVQTAQLSIPYQANVTGSGSLQPTRTDTFGGLPAPKMDVLLIVDDSCSMSEHQMKLAAAFPSFTTWADQQSIDYRIAVTTSSVCSAYPNCSSYESSYANGRFVPLGTGTRVISPTTPNKATVFDQNVRVGVNGDAYEKFLRPAWLALQPGILSGHNAGFLRDDAELAIVFVTDTDDQDPTAVSTYLDYFHGLKGSEGRNKVTLHGILPTLSSAPTGCYYEGGAATRLLGAIQPTGGVAEEICSANFYAAMGRIGRAAFGPRTRYFLSGTPDLVNGTITVTVDGQPLSSTTPGGTKRWTYDAAMNAVDFELDEAPSQTAALAISYDVTCAP